MGSAAALIAAALVVLAGANGVGGAAGVFLRFAPLLIVLILGVHLDDYQPARLAPVLGMGWPAILQGGGKVAGALAPIAALWLVQSGKQTGYARRERRAKPWLMPAICSAAVLIAALWAALALMLEANVFSVPQSRVFRLRLLLSNGSSPTYLQLPYVALWYGAVLCAQGFSLFAAARLLQAGHSPMPISASATGLCTLAAALIAGFRLAEQSIVQLLAPWQAAGTGAFAARRSRRRHPQRRIIQMRTPNPSKIACKRGNGRAQRIGARLSSSGSVRSCCPRSYCFR